MAISQLSQILDPTASRDVRILPAGAFRSADGSGRPAKIAAWQINGAIAQAVIAASFAAQKELLIDYDHQSLRSEQNGQLVPAAGWFSGLEWREGQGLYATRIQWNKRAMEAIAAREYRFISPVFSYANDGVITRILSVAITNTPALPDLADLSQVAVASAVFKPAAVDVQNQRGYELLSRMNQSNSEFAKRIALCSTDGSALVWSQPNANALENQRGMELLARMN